MALTLNNGIKKWIKWLKNDRLQMIDIITEIEAVTNLKVIH